MFFLNIYINCVACCGIALLILFYSHQKPCKYVNLARKIMRICEYVHNDRSLTVQLCVKTVTLTFPRELCKVFQTLRDCYLYPALNFGDAGVISTPQWCWKGKSDRCTFLVSSWPIIFKLYMAATYMCSMIKHGFFCDFCTYLRAVSYTHLTLPTRRTV